MKRHLASLALVLLILTPALSRDQAPAPGGPAAVAQEAPASGQAPAATPERRAVLLDLVLRGGFFMWPILLLFAVGSGYVIERILHFRKANLNPREFIADLENTTKRGTLDDVEKLCAASDLVLAKVISKGLKLRSLGYENVEKSISIAGSIQVSSLERGLNIISAISNIAPLLGFLGTVSGMINAFSNIVAADQVNARLVAGGIEEALLTTAFGLIVAIPLLIAYNYFVHRIDAFVADVERLSADILEMMVEGHEENPPVG
jgi:biopolymer transport protein ExbB